MSDQEDISNNPTPGPIPAETETASQNLGMHEKETVPNMQELLCRAELQGEEHRDAWLRAKAETENVRKRAQEDIAKAHKFAVDNFSQELLAVRDSLEAALATQNATAENMRSGVEITLRQLTGVFEKFSIKEVNPIGERFDPHRHQAMSMIPADAEPNSVVQVFQKGYLLHERVLRPALVAVAKPKDNPDA